jgi:hypothetical protein
MTCAGGTDPLRSCASAAAEWSAMAHVATHFNIRRLNICALALIENFRAGIAREHEFAAG